MFQFLVERRSLALLVGLFCRLLHAHDAERALSRSIHPDRESDALPRRFDRPGRRHSQKNGSVELWQKYQLLKNANEENIVLKRKLQSLNAHHAQIQELKSEVARLKKLLGASRNLEAPVRLARILARSKNIYGESLLLDLGSQDGVRKNMPVMHQAGLVGRISRVGNNVSQVLTLLDSRSAVNVIAQQSRAQGGFSPSPRKERARCATCRCTRK